MSSSDSQMGGGDTESADSDFNDAQLSANEAETKSEEGSGEYEGAFEDVGKCPSCGQEGPLLTHCTYCNHYELRYSVMTGTDDDALNETDEENEAAIASAQAFSRDIAVGAHYAILADVEVESSTESDESNTTESSN